MESETQPYTPVAQPLTLNGVRHSIIIPPPSAAPAFHGKHNESPTQFLIRVEEYAESVHAWDRDTLLKGISQFLRDQGGKSGSWILGSSWILADPDGSWWILMDPDGS